jgi:CHAT domain-containing protein
MDVLAGPAASGPSPDLEPRVGLSSVQRSLDDGTLLVEFALGEERSFLWAVTRETLAAFELAPRREIEAAARRVYEAWSVLDAGGASAEARIAADLSDLVLSPVRARLEAAKRLAVVADGALHYVPFAALPMPGPGDGEPLVAGREVVHLPSAGVLAGRGSAADLPPGPPGGAAAPAGATGGRTVAVLADPVFERLDPRIAAAPSAQTPEPAADGFHRLAMTGREADVLASVVPPDDLLLLLGTEARRDAVLDGRLASSRIVHLATHGLVDSRHPERSGLMLSRFDEAGRPVDGFLSLADVYGLRLAADLVVLSGCETALGREIRGEGLVGLTRGFLHAGAGGVIASLWRVQDRATAELMGRFYRALLVHGRGPAAALRQAQVEMARETVYGDPYHWAAFLLQISPPAPQGALQISPPAPQGALQGDWK